MGTWAGSDSLPSKGQRVSTGETKGRQQHLDFKGSGTGTAHPFAAKQTQTWQRRRSPCPTRERKGQPRATAKASITPRRRPDQPPLPPLPGPEGVFSSGCSTSKTNLRPGTVRTRNQDNHSRAGTTVAAAACRSPSRRNSAGIRPGAGSNACWELESRGGPRPRLGRKWLPAPRFCPILAALGEPTSVSLDVFPREVFANV